VSHINNKLITFPQPSRREPGTYQLLAAKPYPILKVSATNPDVAGMDAVNDSFYVF
jgi:hypothetical protein